MAVVKEVGMAIVTDGQMAAVFAVHVGVVLVLFAGHGLPPRFERSTGKIDDLSLRALEAPT